MSRTNRRTVDRYPLRRPRSRNEKSQLDEILHDPDLKDLPVEKVNRMRSRRGHTKLPDAYDDIVISTYYENDHATKDS